MLLCPILKDTVFNDYYKLTPDKFTNVTNGIAHRRWLCQANPALTAFLEETIGKDFILNAATLEKLAAFKDDKQVLDRIGEIKLHNKEQFASYVKKQTGVGGLQINRR